MNELRFYVGANNDNGDRQAETIEAVLNMFFDSHTVIEAKGQRKGGHELSTLVIVFTEKPSDYGRQCAEALAHHCKQDAVIFQCIHDSGIEFIG